MDVQSPAAVAEALLGALEQHGQGDYIGESINQLEHSLQAAHQARTAGMCLPSPRGEAPHS
jgi:predicted HD phosphohydrolase